MSRCRTVALAAIVGVSALIIGAVPLEAEVIGQATDARNQVTGELGSVVHQISIGSDVSANELVRTGPGSAAGLHFVDGSNLNIGEGSEIVLDTFVFDPNGPADAVVNLTKGALRFVSAGTGPHKATVATPNALLAFAVPMSLAGAPTRPRARMVNARRSSTPAAFAFARMTSIARLIWKSYGVHATRATRPPFPAVSTTLAGPTSGRNGTTRH